MISCTMISIYLSISMLIDNSRSVPLVCSQNVHTGNTFLNTRLVMNLTLAWYSVYESSYEFRCLYANLKVFDMQMRLKIWVGSSPPSLLHGCDVALELIPAGWIQDLNEGGAQNVCVSAQKCVFFQCHTHFQVHNQVWAPWNCDTIITIIYIGINKHEVVEITILRLFVATAVNIKAFLMQEQGDCSPLTLSTQEFSSVFKLIFWVRPPPPGSNPVPVC